MPKKKKAVKAAAPKNAVVAKPKAKKSAMPRAKKAAKKATAPRTGRTASSTKASFGGALNSRRRMERSARTPAVAIGPATVSDRNPK